MKIGIDSRPLTGNYYSGIAVYLNNILRNLPDEANSKEHKFYLYTHKHASLTGFPDNFTIRQGSGFLPGTVWMQTELPGMIMRDGLDIFWGTQHILPVAGSSRVKKVLTIHDLVSKRFPETMDTINLWIHNLLLSPSLKSASIIIADSFNTARDIEYYYPRLKKNIRVIYPGLNSLFSRKELIKAKEYVRNKFNIDKPYILTVGTIEPRKNFITAFRAFENISSKHPHVLVSAGHKGWKTAEIYSAIKQSHAANRVIFLDYVKTEDLPYLYSGADLFMFPSIYEGFGFPPIEAMACGCPVMSSNAASLPEVVGDAGILLPPADLRKWTTELQNALNNTTSLTPLINKGIIQAQQFNWKHSAKQLWDTFKELYGLS